MSAEADDLPSFDSVEWLVHAELGFEAEEARSIEEVLAKYGVEYQDVKDTFDRHMGEVTDEARDLAWLMFISGIVHTLVWRKMCDDLKGGWECPT